MKGWSGIVKYIQSNEHWREIFENVEKEDVDNFLGKDWEWRQSYAYIRRMALDFEDFKLFYNKKYPLITKWVNVKSKWRSTKKYTILLSLHEVDLWNKSLQKRLNKAVQIPDDEQHWYKSLKKRNKVSENLSPKYKKRMLKVEKKRIKRQMRKNEWSYRGESLKYMDQDNLLFYAKERNIDIPTRKPKMKMVEQKKFVLNELRRRDVDNWESKQMCYNTKCKNKCVKRYKCTGCQGSFYCSSNCKVDHWKRVHKKQCTQLWGAVRQQEIINESKIPDIVNRYNNNDNNNTNDNVIDDEDRPRFPKPKSWFDLNFELFDSELSRLQHRCSCRAGVQLPGVCAHTGAIIRLIFHLIKEGGDGSELQKLNSRDSRILDQNSSITNLYPFSQDMKKEKIEAKYWCCYCSSGIVTELTKYMRCSNCYRIFHLDCCQSAEKEMYGYVRENKEMYKKIYHCPICSPQDVYAFANC